MIVYMILFIRMAASMLWIHRHDPFHMDGCIHTVDSCIIFWCLFICIIGHIYIRGVIYCIMFDLQVSWQWYFKLLALTDKALQPSLPILLSCFRGHLLHNILSHSQFYTWSVILCAIVVTNVVKRQKLCNFIHHELHAQHIPKEMEN